MWRHFFTKQKNWLRSGWCSSITLRATFQKKCQGNEKKSEGEFSDSFAIPKLINYKHHLAWNFFFFSSWQSVMNITWFGIAVEMTDDEWGGFWGLGQPRRGGGDLKNKAHQWAAPHTPLIARSTVSSIYFAGDKFGQRKIGHFRKKVDSNFGIEKWFRDFAVLRPKPGSKVMSDMEALFYHVYY